MILTLTLNPSLDVSYRIPSWSAGEVLRGPNATLDGGGKGINVSRASCAQGAKSTAIFPSGELIGGVLDKLLRQTSVIIKPVPIRDDVRINTTITTDTETTKVNGVGPQLSPDELEKLKEVIEAELPKASWFCFCGTVAPGIEPSWVEELILTAVEAGVKVAIDSSGSSLRAALVPGVAIAKPNEDELAECVGRSLSGFNDVVVAADEIRAAKGISTILVTLGEAGALLVDGWGVLRAKSPKVQVESTVGAGDVTLATWVLTQSQGVSRVESLRFAVAAGTAAVQLPGTTVPSQAEISAQAKTILVEQL